MVRLERNQSLLELKPSAQAASTSASKVVEPQPGATSAIATRLLPSSQSLIALDLSVKPERALNTTAMPMHRGRSDRTFASLSIQAKRVSPSRLVDNNGHSYFIGPVFSRGSFGMVRTLLKKDEVVDQRYVVKELNIADETDSYFSSVPHNNDSLVLKKSSLKRLEREVDVLIRFDSPLAPHAVFVTTDRVYLLGARMEGDLFDLTKRIVNEEKHRREVGRAIVERGSEQLIPVHAGDYAHRDIKLDNFLYERSGEIFLYDFGLASHGNGNSSVAGSAAYMPFEALCAPGSHPYSYQAQKADIWSLATTSMRVLTGDHFASDLLESIDYNDITNPDFKPMVDIKFEAYRDAYDFYVQRLSPEVLGRYSGPIADPQPHLSKRFSTLQQQDPALFPVLLSMFHYDPVMRPTAAEVFERVHAEAPYNAAAMQKVVRASESAVTTPPTLSQMATVLPYEPRAGSLPDNTQSRWQQMGTPRFPQIKARLLDPIKKPSPLAQAIQTGAPRAKKATFFINDSSSFSDASTDASSDTSSTSSG